MRHPQGAGWSIPVGDLERAGRPPWDPDAALAEVTSATALTAWRRPQRYGIEYETLIYNSADIANFRVNQNCPQLVRIRVDPSDLTKVTFIDPIDGMGKVVPIQPALAVARGRCVAGEAQACPCAAAPEP